MLWIVHSNLVGSVACCCDCDCACVICLSVHKSVEEHSTALLSPRYL